jgi:hypothetical protein
MVRHSGTVGISCDSRDALAALLAERGRASLEELQVRAGLADLEALGLPTDLLAQFPEWRRGSRSGFRPGPSGLRTVPAGAGEPIPALRLQLSPWAGTIPLALLLLKNLLRALDPEVQVVLVVEPGANLESLLRLTREMAPGADKRVRFAELESATVFSQDNARAAVDAEGRPVLLIPREFRAGKPRSEDALSRGQAERALGVRVQRSQLFWEGGNIVHDRQRAFVGADTVVENTSRLGLTASEVLSSFEAELGTEVHVLGRLGRAAFDGERTCLTRSGQPALHLDLDLSLLGRCGRRKKPVALLADPAGGIDLLPAVLDHRPISAGQFLPPRRIRALLAAEYEACARERHPQLLETAASLEDLGYEVVGMPDLRLDPRENVFGQVNLNFSFCNVLPGLHRGRPAVHYLPWGVRGLDDAAHDRLAQAGVRPIRVTESGALANALMLGSGGLHCVCGPLP